MDGNTTKKEVRAFIKEYNTQIRWNRQIRSGLDKRLVESDNDIRRIVDNCLPVSRLKEYKSDDDFNVDTEVLDIENAGREIFETEDYGCKVLELNAYNLSDCRYRTYFIKPGQSEEEYKKEAVEDIREQIGCAVKESREQISKLSRKCSSLEKLSEMLAEKQ